MGLSEVGKIVAAGDRDPRQDPNGRCWPTTLCNECRFSDLDAAHARCGSGFGAEGDRTPQEPVGNSGLGGRCCRVNQSSWAASNGRPEAPQLTGERPRVDAEPVSDVSERQSGGVAFGRFGHSGVGHLAGSAAPGYASPIEVIDNGGPVDEEMTAQRVDRCPLEIAVDELIDLGRRQPALDRV